MVRKAMGKVRQLLPQDFSAILDQFSRTQQPPYPPHTPSHALCGVPSDHRADWRLLVGAYTPIRFDSMVHQVQKRLAVGKSKENSSLTNCQDNGWCVTPFVAVVVSPTWPPQNRGQVGVAYTT